MRRVNDGSALTFPSPLVGEGGSTARSDGETDEGSASAERTPHPALRATFSHKGRREERRRIRARHCVTSCVTARRANHSKPVQPSREKYSASRQPQINPTTPAIPRPQEGRIAIVTDVGCGERWPRHAGRATSFRRVSLLMSEGRAPTNGVIADGKAVWFWHPLLVSSRRRF